MPPGILEDTAPVEDWKIRRLPDYHPDAMPVFFGHYWLRYGVTPLRCAPTSPASTSAPAWTVRWWLIAGTANKPWTRKNSPSHEPPLPQPRAPPPARRSGRPPRGNGESPLGPAAPATPALPPNSSNDTSRSPTKPAGCSPVRWRTAFFRLRLGLQAFDFRSNLTDNRSLLSGGEVMEGSGPAADGSASRSLSCHALEPHRHSARGYTEADAAAALNALCRAYRQPLYAFARRRGEAG